MIDRIVEFMNKRKNAIIQEFWENNNPEIETEKKYTYQNVQKLAIHVINKSMMDFFLEEKTKILNYKITQDQKIAKIKKIEHLEKQLLDVNIKL
jgi:hypothetical protein